MVLLQTFSVPPPPLSDGALAQPVAEVVGPHLLLLLEVGAGSYLIVLSIVAKFDVLVTSILAFALVFCLCCLGHSFNYADSCFGALASAIRGRGRPLPA